MGKEPWWWHLLKEAGVPKVMLTMLSNSEIVNFTSHYQRAGIVMTKDCKFKWMSSLMYQSCIPFWIQWTPDLSLEGLRTELHFLQPLPQEIQVACCINPPLLYQRNQLGKPGSESKMSCRPLILPRRPPRADNHECHEKSTLKFICLLQSIHGRNILVG